MAAREQSGGQASAVSGGGAEVTAGRASRPLRLLSNGRCLDDGLPGGRIVETEVIRRGQPALLRVLRGAALRRYDAALVNVNTILTLVLCAVKKLVPWSGMRLMAVDLVLTRPRGRQGRARFWLRRWLLGEVDRFLFYFRATEELRRVYGIPADRVRYVPFKPNTRDELLDMKTVDEGFFLACGRSNRDYGLLCEALRGLPCECRILVAPQEATAHGTRLEGVEPPENVRFMTDDGTPASWNRWIARSRAVILPIRPGALSPSGIGTYLVAMALGKPVIITRGPATEGMLAENEAVLVPPGDVVALRQAIERVATDEAFRAEVGAAGQAYALALGGEARLEADVCRELEELVS